MNNKILLGLVILSLILSVASFSYRQTTSILGGTSRASTTIDSQLTVTGNTVLAGATTTSLTNTGALTQTGNITSSGSSNTFTSSTFSGSIRGNSSSTLKCLQLYASSSLATTYYLQVDTTTSTRGDAGGLFVTATTTKPTVVCP